MVRCRIYGGDCVFDSHDCDKLEDEEYQEQIDHDKNIDEDEYWHYYRIVTTHNNQSIV